MLVCCAIQGVGKSCLVLRYVRGQFDPTSKVTVGAAFMSHSVHLPDGSTIKFEIWYSNSATLQYTIKIVCDSAKLCCVAIVKCTLSIIIDIPQAVYLQEMDLCSACVGTQLAKRDMHP